LEFTPCSPIKPAIFWQWILMKKSGKETFQ
jgi:hypothetical protein